MSEERMLTPAEVAAAVQAEREACAEIARHWPTGILTITQQDVADAIRARGDTSALDAALKQARREGMEEAAALIEARGEGLHPTWVAIMKKEVAAIRASAGEAGE